jgi:hypothetical protein
MQVSAQIAIRRPMYREGQIQRSIMCFSMGKTKPQDRAVVAGTLAFGILPSGHSTIPVRSGPQKSMQGTISSVGCGETLRPLVDGEASEGGKGAEGREEGEEDNLRYRHSAERRERASVYAVYRISDVR